MDIEPGDGAPKLKRSINLPLLTLYGLGTTIGAGIYVLIGKVAVRAGVYAPVSFLVAGVLAALTASAFMELSSRYPRSAGEAVYVREGFRSSGLALVVGLMVVAAGIVSSAAIVNGSQGYLSTLIDGPRAPTVIVVVCLLALIAAWGIAESVWVAALVTALEIGGLLLIIWVGGFAPAAGVTHIAEIVPPLEGAVWFSVLTGAFLAFYAFIGFEDMVNVAEEVKDARRVMPLAILLTLIVTGIIYVLIALIAIRAVPLAELAESNAPLATVYQHSTGASPTLITAIGVVATLNGALVQIIMGSRILYGLGSQGALPAVLARVHPWTRTPLIATGLVAALVLILALGFRIEGLAGVTSLIALTTFVLVNLALVLVKRRGPPPPGIFTVPIWLPLTGAIVAVAFLLLEAVRLAGV